MSTKEWSRKLSTLFKGALSENVLIGTVLSGAPNNRKYLTCFRVPLLIYLNT